MEFLTLSLSIVVGLTIFAKLFPEIQKTQERKAAIEEFMRNRHDYVNYSQVARVWDQLDELNKKVFPEKYSTAGGQSIPR